MASWNILEVINMEVDIRKIVLIGAVIVLAIFVFAFAETWRSSQTKEILVEKVETPRQEEAMILKTGSIRSFFFGGDRMCFDINDLSIEGYTQDYCFIRGMEFFDYDSKDDCVTKISCRVTEYTEEQFMQNSAPITYKVIEKVHPTNRFQIICNQFCERFFENSISIPCEEYCDFKL